jgi:recombinational DNA repair protein RecR
MNNADQKRYYSPQFSGLAAVSIRRLAWAMGKHMPAAVDLMVSLLPSIVDTSKVCLSCRDNTKCKSCVFCRTLSTEEKAALLTAL